MKSFAIAPGHRQKQIVLTACLAVALMTRHAVGEKIVGAPIDLSAFVHEALLLGGTSSEDTHSVPGALSSGAPNGLPRGVGPAPGSTVTGRSAVDATMPHS
jgi:hypothetical protein